MEGLSSGIFNHEVESGFVLSGVCDGELERDLCAVREVKVSSMDGVSRFAEPFRGQGVSGFWTVLSVLFHVVQYRCDVFLGEDTPNKCFECIWG